MRRMAVKSYIVVILTLVIVAFLPVEFPRVEAEERNSLVLFDVYGNRFEYYDELIEPTDHLVYEDLFLRKANRSPKEKMELVSSAVRRGISEKKALDYSYPMLEGFVQGVISACRVEAKPAELIFRPNMSPVFLIKRESVGRTVNERALYASVYSAWQRGISASVKLIYDDIAPDFTVEEAKKETCLRASFSTDYSSSTANRKHNIALASSRINGTIIPSGETFSFNKTVGKRTESSGFKEAKIIVGGDFTDGVGGGVCQVSTTVYNAALLSGLEITRAVSHSLPPSYVSPSFDAMVNSGSSDLTVKNSTDRPVYLSVTADGNRVTAAVYGLKNPYEIKRKSVIISRGEIPPDKIIVDDEGRFVTKDMQSGECVRVRSAVAGLKSEGYLLYYENGELVAEKRVRRDQYSPICGIVAKKP